MRRAAEKVEREEAQADDRKRRSLLDVGGAVASVAGALLNPRRKLFTSTNVNKAKSALSGVSRSAEESADVERAEAALEREKEKLAELKADFEAAARELGERYDPETLELGTFTVWPRRADVDVRRVVLAWVPDGALAG